jgi:hypothetical protein
LFPKKFLSIPLHHCLGAAPPSTLSSRLPRRAVGPKRTRISCHQHSSTGRVKFGNTTKFDRKSGVAQRKDLQFTLFGKHLSLLPVAPAGDPIYSCEKLLSSFQGTENLKQQNS